MQPNIDQTPMNRLCNQLTSISLAGSAMKWWTCWPSLSIAEWREKSRWILRDRVIYFLFGYDYYWWWGALSAEQKPGASTPFLNGWRVFPCMCGKGEGGEVEFHSSVSASFKAFPLSRISFHSRLALHILLNVAKSVNGKKKKKERKKKGNSTAHYTPISGSKKKSSERKWIPSLPVFLGQPFSPSIPTVVVF